MRRVGKFGVPTDEDDGGGVLPGDAEEVADARGGHALKHLHKFGAIGREEGHIGGARHGLGQVRLARTWRALQQNSLHPTSTCQLGRIAP